MQKGMIFERRVQITRTPTSLENLVATTPHMFSIPRAPCTQRRQKTPQGTAREPGAGHCSQKHQEHRRKSPSARTHPDLSKSATPDTQSKKDKHTAATGRPTNASRPREASADATTMRRWMRSSHPTPVEPRKKVKSTHVAFEGQKSIHAIRVVQANHQYSSRHKRTRQKKAPR